MKTLTEAQERAVKVCINSIAEYGGALNSSKTGTGKTVMAVHVALRMRCPVIVICPKAVRPHWEREFAEHGIEPLAVLNYEKVRNGSTPFLRKQGKRAMRWELPEDALIIFDECQRMKSPYTLNALLLISAKMQKINTLLLSATAAEDCTEMRALGYALNLHNLNRDTPLLRSWERWMREHGCYRDEWNGWRSGPRKHLQKVHDVLYRDRAIRLTEEDMPEAFRENRIIVEPIEFAGLPAIRKAYKDAGITPAIVEAVIERSALPPEEQEKLEEDSMLTRLLRARQLAEACKVPEFVELAQDLVAEGFSVAVFLTFRETVLAFQQLMESAGIPAAVIIGGQTSEVREANRLAFSRDEKRVLVCTAASGGVGIDGLQDLNGRFPRTSLISPSFSVQEFKQTLGRLHRAYAKSDVMQKILIAVGTVEEDVIVAIQRKLANMETLHGK
jgi:hypothetical protein